MIVAPPPARTVTATRARGGDCSIKKRFTSRKFAATIASRIRSSSGEPHEYYHCLVHHCWHTGRPVGYRSSVGLAPIVRYTSGPLAGCEILNRSADLRGMLHRRAPRVLSSRPARGRQSRP